MSAYINHAAEAARIMTDGEHAVAKARDAAHNGTHRIADGYGAKAHGCWMQAQVHATLALVEQQRIANLISLSVDLDPDTHDALYTRGDDVSTLRPEIRKALGIA